MDINVSKKIDGKTHNAKVSYDFGENLESMVALFGEEVVFNNARQSMVITLQGRLRAKITEPLTVLEKIASEWVPGIVKAKKSKSEKATSIMDGMSKEELAAILAKYK